MKSDEPAVPGAHVAAEHRPLAFGTGWRVWGTGLTYALKAGQSA